MEAPKGTIREVAVSDLTPHPDNYRQHPPEQVSRIAESLRRYGQRRAIVVQAGTMRVIAGNGVLAAAPEAGLETLICDVWPCDDETARAYLVEDNEAVYGAEDDRTALAELLADLGQARPPSFPDDRLEDLLREVTMPRMGDVEEDDPPEPQAEAVSRTGDLWLLGEAHRLLCGDCTVAADVEKLVGEGERATLVWTDPPYGVAYQTKLSVEEAAALHRRTDGLEVANDALTHEQTEALCRDALTLAATTATGPGAACYVACPAGTLLPHFIAAVAASGFTYKHSLVWVKQQFVMGRADYHYRHETVLYGWKEDAAHFFVDDRTKDSVFEIDRPSTSPEHPTMKPVALVARMVENSSRVGDGVYDPFLGSGTTLIACEQLGRRCYGIEIEPRYVDVAVRRWQTLTGKDALLESTGRTFAQEENLRLHG